MQTSLPLLIVRPSIVNLVMYFSTHLWPVKWNTLGYTFALRIPFHLLWCWYNTCTNQSPNDMIHFISSSDHIGSSILTSLALHHCVGTSTPSLAQASPSHAVSRFKASDLPFTLATGPSNQASSWSSSPWSHDSMSCLTCNELLHDIITCGLIHCVSHINTISPPKVVTQLPKPNKDLSYGGMSERAWPAVADCHGRRCGGASVGFSLPRMGLLKSLKKDGAGERAWPTAVGAAVPWAGVGMDWSSPACTSHGLRAR
jgi:hypothetical protein